MKDVKTMNPKWLKLAGDMLELASDKFSNHGCNDWSWPKDWSSEDRREFIKAIAKADNCEPEMYGLEEQSAPPDWLIMEFLGGQLGADNGYRNKENCDE